MKKDKTIKAWAIIASFPEDKKFADIPYVDAVGFYYIFSDKKWAKEFNEFIGGKIAEVEIKVKK